MGDGKKVSNRVKFKVPGEAYEPGANTNGPGPAITEWQQTPNSDPRNQPAGFILGANGESIPYWVNGDGGLVDQNGLELQPTSRSTPASPTLGQAAPVARGDAYWTDPNHKASTPQEAENKLDAYYRARDSGTPGAQYLDQNEIALLSQQPGWNIQTTDDGGKSFAAGAGPGAAIGAAAIGPIGAVIGGAFGGAVGEGFHAASGNTQAVTGPSAPAGGWGPGSVPQGGYSALGGQYGSALGGASGAPAQSTVDLQNAAIQAQYQNQLANQGRFQNVAQAQQNLIGYQNTNNAILEQQRQDAANANAADLAALGDYKGSLAQSNQFLDQNLGTLQTAYGNYHQLAPSASSQWQGDLTSQAAQAYADPQAVAAQYQALGQLQNAAAGGLNTTSQAAQAYADPEAVAMQKQGINDLYAASKGSLDVHLDPALLARQNQALDQYDAWRTPQLTAQEAFMKELARLDQEQQEKASRDAVYRNLSDRGMGGSGLELANMQMQSQQNSTNRMLRDMDANAQAVARAERALQGYANMSTDMQGQYLANAHSNQAVQLQALGLYTDAAGNLRSQTFDEAYKRGLAGDQTAIANANRQLQAAGMSADTAGNIRQQSFNESYARGSAADNMAQYNRSTSLAASQWADSYRADQQNQAAGRDATLFNAGITTNAGKVSNAGNQFGASTQVNQTNYGRNVQTNAAANNTNNQNWNAGNQVLDRSDNAWTQFGGTGQQAFNNQNTVTQTQIDDERRRQQADATRAALAAVTSRTF